jgi:hypothetical protein
MVHTIENTEHAENVEHTEYTEYLTNIQRLYSAQIHYFKIIKGSDCGEEHVLRFYNDYPRISEYVTKMIPYLSNFVITYKYTDNDVPFIVGSYMAQITNSDMTELDKDKNMDNHTNIMSRKKHMHQKLLEKINNNLKDTYTKNTDDCDIDMDIINNKVKSLDISSYASNISTSRTILTHPNTPNTPDTVITQAMS